jgi:hypothetical protein
MESAVSAACHWSTATTYSISLLASTSSTCVVSRLVGRFSDANNPCLRSNPIGLLINRSVGSLIGRHYASN